jgi:hypothetical protein
MKMALIKCPECNREISDQSGACIGCGIPIKRAEQIAISEAQTTTNAGKSEANTKRETTEKEKQRVVLLIIAAIPVSLFMAYVMGFMFVGIPFQWRFLMMFGVFVALIGSEGASENLSYGIKLFTAGLILAITGFMLRGVWVSPELQAEKDLEQKIEQVKKQQSASRSVATTAYVYAEEAVKKKLKSPSTAIFPYFDTSSLSKSSDGSYTISSYVDSQNSFGATVRSQWNCKMKPVSGGWSAICMVY